MLNLIPIFRLIQSAVYPVGVSKDCSCFTQMIYYNSKDFVRILTKIYTGNRLWTPYKCIKCKLQRFFQVYKKTKKKKNEEKTRKFAHSYLGNNLVCTLPWQAAPPQQLWCSSDKRSWSNECVKIATLLFLLIYSCTLHAPRFLQPHDTLPCVLISGLLAEMRWSTNILNSHKILMLSISATLAGNAATNYNGAQCCACHINTGECIQQYHHVLFCMMYLPVGYIQPGIKCFTVSG